MDDEQKQIQKELDKIYQQESGELMCIALAEQIIEDAQNLIVEQYYAKLSVPYAVDCAARDLLDVVNVRNT